MRRSVPILMYHRVIPYELETSAPANEVIDSLVVTPDQFARQMAWLARKRYQTISISDLLDARENHRSLPRRAVVITFDDGYQDFVQYAAPVLQMYGFSAHLFLVAGLVGQSARWDQELFDWDAPLFDWDAPLFDWETARKLEVQGFHCDAHSMTHPALASLTDAERYREVNECHRILNEELGREVVHFAYPYGSFNEETVAAVKEAGFRSGCSVLRGRSPEDDDPYSLRRMCVHLSDRHFDFKLSVVLGLPLRSGVKRRIRRYTNRFRSRT